ncbi:MAG: hypothetical protein DYG94_02525 [Leptolyngbya sp. PLA3]|nr:MAG: hypothetical protein EDM82_02030 [Cyanobacteria bacterium CYA]MCE7967604.1 hypothetical protein [Leptolyngbya sp. PL-A3]
MKQPTLLLRNFGPGVRLGLTLLCLVILGGSGVSGYFLREHHAGRDLRQGFSFDDIRAHYHGMRSKSPMIVALEEKNHPANLDPKLREALINWLNSDRLTQDYDNFDLGDLAPAEILAANCVSCHDANATGPDAYPQLPLRYFDDVRTASVSRNINPVDPKKLIISLHAHSLGLASLCMVTVLLLALTRAPSPCKGVLAVLIGGGLLVDLAAWIPAADNAAWVYAIMGGGFAFQAGTVLALCTVILDLWLPLGKPR